MIKIFSTFIGLGAFLFATASGANSVNGKVVGVMSGDTLSIQTPSGKTFKVRLKAVDAPELQQPFGKQARQFTQDLTLDKTVAVNYKKADLYLRVIGDVILPDGRILNHELLSNGYAWHYGVHYPANEFLRELEYRAWKGREGLWVNPHAVPPWNFRREAFLPDPPENSTQMDYDKVFFYGLIGDPETKIYLWPKCRNYPKKSQSLAVFSSKSEAKDSGFKISPDCPKP